MSDTPGTTRRTDNRAGGEGSQRRGPAADKPGRGKPERSAGPGRGKPSAGPGRGKPSAGPARGKPERGTVPGRGKPERAAVPARAGKAPGAPSGARRGKAGSEDRFEKTGRAGARVDGGRRGNADTDAPKRGAAGPGDRSEKPARTREAAVPRDRSEKPARPAPRPAARSVEERKAGPRDRSEKPARSARTTAGGAAPGKRSRTTSQTERPRSDGKRSGGKRSAPQADSRAGARAKALPRHGINPGPTARATRPAAAPVARPGNPSARPAKPSAAPPEVHKVTPATARSTSALDDDDDDDDALAGLDDDDDDNDDVLAELDDDVEVEPNATPARAARLRDVEARLLAAADAAQAAEHAATRRKPDAARPPSPRTQPPPAFNVETEAASKPQTPARDSKPRREPSALRTVKPEKQPDRQQDKQPRQRTPEHLAPVKVRLQKVLASAGVAARRKAEDLITGRRVTVNGRIVDELGVKVDPDRDQIKVNGKLVQVEKKVYYVLNKPDGVVCSAEGPKDPEGRPTVLTLLPTVTQRVYPVGRLDFHSRGVLILTNDGELAAALTHPRHKVAKTYHVKFQGRLDEATLAALGQGITLEDGTVTRPAEEVSVVKETSTNTWAQITLRQGLNRQIRRMGEALGHPVLKLIRVAVGAVTADGLADGEFRPLTPTEVYDLMAAALR